MRDARRYQIIAHSGIWPAWLPRLWVGMQAPALLFLRFRYEVPYEVFSISDFGIGIRIQKVVGAHLRSGELHRDRLD